MIGKHKFLLVGGLPVLVLWMDLGTDNRLVEEVAAGFDELLRTGELDNLFVLPGEGG